MGLFGPDKITVTLEKYDYKPGDVIKGNVGLNLKKPVQARKITVALIGIRIQRTTGMNARGQPTTQTQSYKIYNFEIPLDEENEYFNEMYPFEIKIPLDILQSGQRPANQQTQGILADLAKLSEEMMNANSRVEWSVEANLDVPMKIDVRKSQKIVLSP